MDERELRLECLKLARTADLNSTLATAKAYEDYVTGVEAAPEKRKPGRPKKVEKPDPFED
jgi:hypothetical protein